MNVRMLECENESIIVEYEYAARDASSEEPTFTTFRLVEQGDGGPGVLFFLNLFLLMNYVLRSFVKVEAGCFVASLHARSGATMSHNQFGFFETVAIATACRLSFTALRHSYAAARTVAQRSVASLR